MSYFVTGVTGASSRNAEWCGARMCEPTALLGLVVNVAERPTFPEIGHLTAFGIELATVPLTLPMSAYRAVS
jgi:hypothetical protein